MLVGIALSRSFIFREVRSEPKFRLLPLKLSLEAVVKREKELG